MEASFAVTEAQARQFLVQQGGQALDHTCKTLVGTSVACIQLLQH